MSNPGARFKQLRTRHFQCSQTELATRCNLAPATISKLENWKGKNAVNSAQGGRIATLNQVATHTGLEPNKLLAYLNDEIELHQLVESNQTDDPGPAATAASEVKTDQAGAREATATTLSPPVDSRPSEPSNTRRSKLHSRIVAAATVVGMLAVLLVVLLLKVYGPVAEQLEASSATETPQVNETDSSKSASERPSPEFIYPIFVVHALDESRVWIGGAHGTIIATDDGFQTWHQQPTNSDTAIQSIFFDQRGNKGWAVGRGGVILHTDDGGRNWWHQRTRYMYDLRSVHFLDDGTTGFAAGDTSTILHTKSGGTTWARIPPHVEGDYIDRVYFATPERGWAVAENGLLLQTRDGGEAWQPRTLTRHRLWSIDFQESEGWIVGDDGEIFHSTDAGETWHPRPVNGVTSPLQDVCFVDPRNGWIVGKEIILHTSDGGADWEPESLPVQTNLWSISMVNRNEGWAVGREPSVLLYRDTNGWRVFKREDVD